MSAVGFTPIQLFRTTTASATPTALSLADGELAINLTDEKLYFKNASGVVKLLASNAGSTGSVTSVDVSGGTTGLTFSGGPITSSGTITMAGTLAVANGGTGVTTSTGTGSVVLSNSPTLVTPTLGVASATSITTGKGLVGSPAYTFTANTNTGMWSPSADAIAFSTAGSERMRIDGSGNVGIGTSSPVSLLHIQANDPRITFRDTSGTSAATNYFQIGQAGASGEFCFLSADPNNVQPNTVMQFSVDGSERARIDSSGNLLVGKTAADDSTAGTRIANVGQISVVRDNQITAIFDRLTSDGVLIRFRRSNANVGDISVTTTATSYNTSSDYRLKDIDGPIANSGAYIDALKPVQGSWKADGSRFIGLLAHEVQEVSETAIATGEKDGEEMQAMDYSAPEIIANLIAEIQSLRARVAQLEGN